MPKVLADDRFGTIADKELVLRCQNGDSESFRQLYRRYQQRVRSTLYQFCDARNLDDTVQEVFLKVWRGLPKLRQPEYFSTWLYRLTWNVAIEQKRKFVRHSQEESSKAEYELLDLIPSRSHQDPDLMRLHYQDLVRKGLQSLSLDHRAVLVLHDLEGLTQKEIAEILNVPVGTVKSRLFNARSAARKFFQQQGELL
jgi:RNA polymerase sigma-70 factor (ECF subfamily)